MNATANLYREIGGWAGAYKINGRWVGFRDLRYVKNLPTNLARWQGPPSKAIVKAINESKS